MPRGDDLRGGLGARLRELRLARHLTQEQLAERAGLSYKFIGEVERGRGNPTLTTLGALADALQIYVRDLLPARPGEPAEYPLSPQDVLLVREALESIENTLVGPKRPPGRRARRR